MTDSGTVKSGNVIKSTLDKDTEETTTATVVATVALATIKDNDTIRALQFVEGENTIVLTEDENGYVFGSFVTSGGNNGALTDVTDEDLTVEYLDRHHHLYGATNEADAVNINKDSKFTVMEFLGVPYVTTSSSGDYLSHYVECVGENGCGLNYLEVKHAETCSTACAKCKYVTTLNAYFDVTINDESEAEVDKFYVPANTALELDYSNYQPFNGKKVDITGWTALTC